jgi:fumarate reductase subunit C
MAVVVTVSAVLFAILYFRKIASGFLRQGVLIGIIWFVINIVIDLMLFMEGPMKMSFADYMMDIGLTYLIIPAVTIGFGYLLQRKT